MNKYSRKDLSASAPNASAKHFSLHSLHYVVELMIKQPISDSDAQI